MHLDCPKLCYVSISALSQSGPVGLCEDFFYLMNFLSDAGQQSQLTHDSGIDTETLI